MSGDKGASFPIAAIGVAALLAGAAFLSPHAFDLMRLAESDTAKQGLLLQPPVEARLWEDPLGALVRHRAKFKERCTRAASVPRRRAAPPPAPAARRRARCVRLRPHVFPPSRVPRRAGAAHLA